MRAFLEDRRGNIAMMFALAVVPVCGMVGLAVDFARMSAAKEQLQAAVDTAALSFSAASGTDDIADLEGKARAFLVKAHAGNHAVLQSGARVTRDGAAITITAEAVFRPSFASVLGQGERRIAASATSIIAERTIEVMLALDNTGSMGRLGKIEELRKASRSLVDVLAATSKKPGDVKIGLAPFDTQVKVTTAAANEPWLKYDAPELFGWQRTSPGSWGGCIIDRDAPHDASGVRPDGSEAKKHLAVRCAGSSLARLAPLTDDFAGLKTSISAMQPNGCTNVTMGAVWGQTMLTPNAPLSAAGPAKPGLERYLILLTDGDNTQSRYTNGSCDNANSPALMDARTRAACADARAAGITLYTVQVIDGSDALMRDCASTDKNGVKLYHKVDDAADLDGVFRKIAAEIGGVRLVR